MTFPSLGFSPEGKAHFFSLFWQYSYTFHQLLKLKLQQLFSRLNLRRKISSGCILVIGIAVLGIVIGLNFSESYRKQTAAKLIQAQAEEHLLVQLQISVLETQLAQQDLSSLLQAPKLFSTQQVNETKSQLLNQLKKSKKNLQQIYLAQANYSKNLRIWLKKYESVVNDYRQKLEIILLDINAVKVEPKIIQSAERLLLNFSQTQEAIAFSHLARDLTQLIEHSQQKQQEVAIASARVEKRQLQMMSATTLLSVTVAALLATYTSRAIAYPLEAITQVVQEIVEDNPTTQQVPTTNQAEIQKLTTALADDITERQPAELQLQPSKYQQNVLFNNIPDEIVQTTPNILYIYDLVEQRNIYSNRQIAETLGYSPDEIVAMGADVLPNLLHPDDLSASLEHLHEIATAKEDRFFEIEYRMQDAQGEWHWFCSRETVFSRTADGKPKQILGSAEDITERKRIQEALQQSEARYRELANRETLLNRLAKQIRQSLDLDTILGTAVIEIRHLLQLDRCFFFWYRSETTSPHWEVVQDAKNPDLPSFINNCVAVTEIQELMAKVCDPEIKLITIGDTETLYNPIERNFFLSLGYSAVLLMPIHTQSGDIGVICCTYTNNPRFWSNTEVEMLQAVGDQIAIAIDQAQLLQQSYLATTAAVEQANKLELTLSKLQQAQTQLVQSEKMSSLGQLVAGIAHEINNPVSFIYGNIMPIKEYAKDLFDLIQLYQDTYPRPTPDIQAKLDRIDLDFIKEDLPKILSSMKTGSERIRQIVLSLRNFSRLDEAGMKRVDIHEGLNNTLLILSHRLSSKNPEEPDIQVIKDYGNLPKVQCYAGQLNQVFMNILTNAIDAIEAANKQCLKDRNQRPGTILICTEVLNSNQAIILIGDNGIGMKKDIVHKLFDPFFTTKPIGSGTGLGMTISYKIVEKHGGQMQCLSAPHQGTAILIQIPIHQENKRAQITPNSLFEV